MSTCWKLQQLYKPAELEMSYLRLNGKGVMASITVHVLRLTAISWGTDQIPCRDNDKSRVANHDPLSIVWQLLLLSISRLSPANL